MAGGIDISTGTAATLGETAALALVSVSTGGGFSALGLQLPTLGPYRDKQQNKPATYSLTVPATRGSNVGETATQASDGSFKLAPVPVVAPTIYVFDAVKKADHVQNVRATRKPLQSGYNISDHALLEQPTVTLEIGMSDAMAEYKKGMWTGNPSKSISAWEQLKKMASNRVLLTLATRQQTYTNMMIVHISSPETNETVKSLKATVIFEQMFLVSVSSQTISSRSNSTDSTLQAIQQTETPPETLLNQHTQTNLDTSNSNGGLGPNGVPVGGQFSSNNTGGK